MCQKRIYTHQNPGADDMVIISYFCRDCNYLVKFVCEGFSPVIYKLNIARTGGGRQKTVGRDIKLTLNVSWWICGKDTHRHPPESRRRRKVIISHFFRRCKRLPEFPLICWILFTSRRYVFCRAYFRFFCFLKDRVSRSFLLTAREVIFCLLHSLLTVGVPAA